MRIVHVVTRMEREHNRNTGTWGEWRKYRLSVHDPGAWPGIMVKRHEEEMRKRPGISEHAGNNGHVFLEELSPGQPGTWLREIRFAILTEENE